jgi:hypothetical protein
VREVLALEEALARAEAQVVGLRVLLRVPVGQRDAVLQGDSELVTERVRDSDTLMVPETLVVLETLGHAEGLGLGDRVREAVSALLGASDVLRVRVTVGDGDSVPAAVAETDEALEALGVRVADAAPLGEAVLVPQRETEGESDVLGERLRLRKTDGEREAEGERETVTEEENETSGIARRAQRRRSSSRILGQARRWDEVKCA